MRSVTTVLIELCLLHCVIGWRNSTSHFKQVKPPLTWHWHFQGCRSQMTCNCTESINLFVFSLQVGRVHEQTSVQPRHLAAKLPTDPTAPPPWEEPLPWQSFPSSPWTPALPLPHHPLRSRGRESYGRVRRGGQTSLVNPIKNLQDLGMEHLQVEGRDRKPRVRLSVVGRAY